MIIKCKMCGGDLAFTEGSSVCECEFCGSMQTIPNVDNEKKANLFNRANRLRLNNEFDKASAVYESIVAEFPEEAEAYWGLCLCNYGIEYVDDPGTGKKLPTCHRTLTESIMEDSNFEQACDNADSVARRVYRDEAKAIDRIQKDILSIAATESPYDVFICYKETAQDGGRTEDSVLAQDIYDSLSEKGLKVFFSRITLEDKLGVQYEPYIYAALSSAKVMLAIGTQFEYYDAVWVKNEWSRFLGMMKTDRTKTLIPCFKDLDAYDMPNEFKSLQAQDMSKLGWLQDLIRGVMKLCGKGDAIAVEQQNAAQTVLQSREAEESLHQVYVLMEEEKWDQASASIENVLDINVKYAPAYVALVLIQYKLKNESELTSLRHSIDTNANWQKALRFADEYKKKAYESYAKTINENEAYDKERAQIIAEKSRIEAEKKAEKALLEARKNAEQKKRNECNAAAQSAMKRENYPEAIVAYHKLGYSNMVKHCVDAYRQKIKLEKEKNPDTDTKLKETQDNVLRLKKRIQVTKETINEAKASIAELDKREQTLTTEIQSLSKELEQVHGLFGGGKKRELEKKIEIEKKELYEKRTKKQEISSTVELTQVQLSNYVNELTSANAEVKRLETILSEATLTDLKDDDMVSAIIEAARQAFTKVGSIVTYGRYPQSKDNSIEAIEWIVIKYESKTRKALLLSRYGLASQKFAMTGYPLLGWEASLVRRWLNERLLDQAFTAEEQLGIIPTIVDNSKSQAYNKWGTKDWHNTQDKLFVFSDAEVKDLLNNKEVRKCAPTAKLREYLNSSCGTSKKANQECCDWWLRSPGHNDYCTEIVLSDGTLSSVVAYSVSGVIRPALWIDLNNAPI